MTATWDSDVDLTVEIAFGYGPFENPVWTDVSAYVRGITTDRQHSRILDSVQAGEMLVTFDNSDSRFDPGNTSGDYTPDVKPGVPIRVYAAHDAVTYHLFRGFVTGWPQQIPTMGDYVVAAPCVDGFRYLAMREGDWTRASELSGARVEWLLDQASWPGGWRDVDAGTHTIAALAAQFDTALGQVRRAALVEQGLFWVAGNGDATFRDANTRIQDRTVQATFSDDGSDLSYSFPNFDYDDTQLWNSASVTKAGGVEQTATDATSITAHGRYDLHLANTLHHADGEANALAEWLVEENKDVRLRVSELVLYPMKDEANLWPVALGLEFWDLVNVERTPPSGSTIDVNCFVQGISHEITKVGGMRWDTTIQLTPDLTHGADYWILGTSELGTETRLGY